MTSKKTTGKAKVNTNVRGSRKKSFSSTQVNFNSDFILLLDNTPAGNFKEDILQRRLLLPQVQRNNPVFDQFRCHQRQHRTVTLNLNLPAIPGEIVHVGHCF
jgi:hypothetical protein